MSLAMNSGGVHLPPRWARPVAKKFVSSMEISLTKAVGTMGEDRRGARTRHGRTDGTGVNKGGWGWNGWRMAQVGCRGCGCGCMVCIVGRDTRVRAWGCMCASMRTACVLDEVRDTPWASW